MRILHLGDLHLGRSIFNVSLCEDQEYILSNIIGIVKDKKIEVVLISGDVYDKNIPSIDACSLFDNFFNELNRFKVKVLIISGNHDSGDRLSFGKNIFKNNDIYISTSYDGKLDCVSIDDEYGSVNFYMLPFIKPINVKKYYEGVESYDDAFKEVINNTKIDYSKRNVLMLHQFMTGSSVTVERSDSEVLSLGGIDNVDVSTVLNFDYVAMGHVHGAQRLIKDTIRYSGSPLKYSFSEVNQHKSVPIITFEEKGNIDVELISLNPLRDMRVIKGKLDDLIRVGEKSEDYVSVTLVDDNYIIDALDRLRSIYPNLLHLEYDNKKSINIQVEDSDNDIEKKSEFDLFKEFYLLQNGIEIDSDKEEIIKDLFSELKENM